MAPPNQRATVTGVLHAWGEGEGGQQVGRSVAEFVFANFMAPRDRRDN